MYRMPTKAVYQTKVCQCGCKERFKARLNYRHRDRNGKATFPIYKRGHHPNCRKTQTGNIPAWNDGLTKADHPSLERMGFQPGHEPFNDWSKVNERLRNDPKLRKRWLQSKKGQVAWNAGLTKAQYPNGIASGPDHGNWLGGDGGVRDTAAYKEFRRSILKRDRWTCQECGDRNHKGRGSRIVLNVDHIEPICVALDRALDPTNARTLCFECHKKTETYGPKVRLYIKKLGSKRQGGSV
jgi:hypothetical protein